MRIVHKRRAADFRFRLFDLLTDNLKRYTIRCDRKFYVVPEGDHIVASVEIIAQYKDLPRRRPAERLATVLETLGLEEMQPRFFTTTGTA